MRGSVLLIDDDRKLRGLLTEYLGTSGFAVVSAGHADEGLRLLRTEHPSIVILDVMLPGMDGFEVCRAIRLELGADDYLAKPFEPRELVARMDAILRRGHSSAETWSFGGLHVDPSRRSATMGGEEIPLTTAEFDLLEMLIRGRGRVLSRGQILDGVRGESWDAFDRSIDVLVSRLRNKLGDDPKHPRYVRTIRGAGYAFVGAPDDDA
jgi:DNA-binding response OmpR family regulator